MDMEYGARKGFFVSGADHQPSRGQPALAVLPADVDPVDPTAEWAPEHFGQSRDGRQHRYWVTMDEHQIRIRINRPYRPEREDMIRALQYPAPLAAGLMPQMLQEALVKTIPAEVPGIVEPTPVAGYSISRIEAQAGEQMRRDLGTFLRRTRLNRMQTAELRRQQPEQAQLPRNLLRAPVSAGAGSPGRIGMDQLPYAGHEICRILRQQIVQKGGARAWQAGNQQGPFDRLVENFRRTLLLFTQTQQV